MADIFYKPFITVENDCQQTLVQGDIKTLYISMPNVDLTNLGVNFTMSSMQQYNPLVPISSSWPVVVNRACTVNDAPNGVSFITLSSTETAITGTYRCQVALTNISGTLLQTVFMFNLLILDTLI
jgi:hypothetical protein